MREILFRGKLTSGCGWSYGNLVVNVQGTAIITPDKSLTGKYGQVIPETVGQFTGLTDKNGKRIFEGDIVNFKTIAYTFKKCVVKYDEQYARFACIDFNKAGFPMDISFVYEIIGNIHDNPELLEGTK